MCSAPKAFMSGVERPLFFSSLLSAFFYWRFQEWRSLSRRVEKIEGRSTQDIKALGTFTKVNPCKFTIQNYCELHPFLLEVWVKFYLNPIIIENFRPSREWGYPTSCTIYYTILSATWKFQTLNGGWGKSLRVKAYCLELLKILW